MLKDKLANIILLVAGSLCFQMLVGMSGDGQFAPVGEPVRIAFPYLRELQERTRRLEHASASSSNISAKSESNLVPQVAKKQFSEQEMQELLKKEMTLYIYEFIEDNLRDQQRLDQVGILVVDGGLDGLVPANLIGLIEKYFPHVLRLKWNELINLRDGSFKALAQSKIAAQLKVLDISECEIADNEFTRETFNRFVSLEEFVLYKNPMGDINFKALAQSNIAPQLKKLEVWRCEITDEEFTLKNLNRFKSLEVLLLKYKLINDIDFKVLAQSNIAAQLKKLYVMRCYIKAQEFTTDNLNRFENLEKLGLELDQLSENAIGVVMHSNLCQTLQEINGLGGDISTLLKNCLPLNRR